MNTRTLTLRSNARSSAYTVEIGCGLLPETGSWLKSGLGVKTKIVIVSNDTVFGLYGETVKGSLDNAGFQTEVFLVPDGEEFKSLSTAENSLEFFSLSGLTRNDCVVALGGGVVCDLAGFAASIYLRGVKCFYIPTTLLAMIDASIGGKTGVNTKFGKNLTGTFHQPSGVLIDVATLQTLGPRDFRAGLYEAVKQAAISGEELFENVRAFLSGNSDGARKEELAELVFRQVSFKASIVEEDALESAERSDARSRKILNFGHTAAHALEKVTEYSYFTHGEAVGYGIIVAADISKRLEICPSDSIDLLNDVVRSVGVLPDASNISITDVLGAIEHDKKASGNSVQWILLEDIGRPVIYSGSEIPPNVIKESIERAISRRSDG
ncbi:MAG: 3-dehydroquinate synthase [Acidobacteriota bacterium]|nr:MAG: 3-dehydroquinate synthase [Acidobacteriota bacterium]